MKVRKITQKDLANIYNHPSAVLFRAVELQGVFSLVKDIDFRGKSMDLGCGDGEISELLFDSRFDYGVDNGEAQDVDIAIEKKRYKKVYLESAEDMSIRSSSLSFVFSNSVIEHIPDNEAVLSETYRILRTGGYFLFTSPSNKFGDYLFVTKIFRDLKLNFLAEKYIAYRNKKLNHYHLYSHKQYERRLKKAGFEVVDYHYVMDENGLYLWDLMAVLVLVFKFFKLPHKRLLDLFYNKIHTMVLKQAPNKKSGGNLVILAQKKK